MFNRDAVADEITHLLKETKTMTTVKVQDTCKDRIKDSLKSFNDDLTALYSNPESDEYYDDPALSIDTYTLTSVCLSYGGPSSYLEIKHSGSDIVSVTYRFSDWFDTATTPVLECEPAYDYARSIVEGLE